MFDRFGPWSTALGDDVPTHRLDTFWKRRLTLLAATRSARQIPRRRDWFLLTVAALAILGVPTFHLATAQDSRSPAKATGPGKIYIRADFNPVGGQDPALRGFFAVDVETKARVKVADWNFDSLRVAPDRQRYALNRDGWWGNGKRIDNPGTWVVAAEEGATERQIADFGGAVMWLPDGKELIVSRGFTPGFGGAKRLPLPTWRMNLDGSNATHLPLPTTGSSENLSPDGQWVVTLSNRDEVKSEGYQLYRMKLDGSEELRLTDGTGNNVLPSFSPDGKQILFFRVLKANQGGICVVNTDGSGFRRVYQDQGDNHIDVPRWSPDGRSIAFTIEPFQRDGRDNRVLGNGPTSPRIMLIDVDGTNLRPLDLPTTGNLTISDWR